MRRVEFLIQQVREISRTAANPDSTGTVLDNTIIQYLNDAQDRLQGLFLGLKNVQRPFIREAIVSITSGQETYSIPDRLAMNKHVQQVMYSYTGNDTDYVLLDKVNIFNRERQSSNNPVGYFIANGQIYLAPPPNTTTGKLRVFYDRALDDLDKRRGAVASVAGLTSTGFTSLTVDSTADETSTPNLSTTDYVCICDADGAVTAYNIPVASYVTATNVLTPRAGYTFQTGETIAAGSYLTLGKYSTTHSDLPDDCETYLIHYAAEACLQQESSTDVVGQSQRLMAIEEGVVKAFKAQSGEVHYFPTLNYLDW